MIESRPVETLILGTVLAALAFEPALLLAVDAPVFDLGRPEQDAALDAGGAEVAFAGWRRLPYMIPSMESGGPRFTAGKTLHLLDTGWERDAPEGEVAEARETPEPGVEGDLHRLRSPISPPTFDSRWQDREWVSGVGGRLAVE